MKRVAIIPARGGSKRIPNKNIRSFMGKPMILHTLKTCKDSNLFDKIHVSTDSLKIKEVVENFKIKIDFLRPKDLADDSTPIMPVLKYVLTKYKDMKIQFDQVWLILPCSPLISKEDLINAEKIYHSQKNKTKLMSVAKYPVPIEWAFKKNEHGILKAVNVGAFEIPSQNIDPSFYDTGNFSIFSEKDIVLSSGAGEGDNFIPFEIPFTRGLDIDDEEDWVNAEKIFSLSNETHQ